MASLLETLRRGEVIFNRIIGLKDWIMNRTFWRHNWSTYPKGFCKRYHDPSEFIEWGVLHGMERYIEELDLIIKWGIRNLDDEEGLDKQIRKESRLLRFYLEDEDPEKYEEKIERILLFAIKNRGRMWT